MILDSWETVYSDYGRVLLLRAFPAAQGCGGGQVIMLAFPPCGIGVLAAQRYFDSHIGQLPDQRFGFGQVAADIGEGGHEGSCRAPRSALHDGSAESPPILGR